ncbi:hypothetical protein C8R45DRAFT_1207504 [Mycena sanguinolenta]|nr:hypothetical protein C8R45DRAFT_1207504 [Mycena sanguinolenta]
MRSSIASIIAAVLVATMAAKGDIIGWSGANCNGEGTQDFPCDGSCIPFDGKNSFEIVFNAVACVAVYENAGCVGDVFTFASETQGSCINVNTGTPIGSLRCFLGPSCG